MFAGGAVCYDSRMIRAFIFDLDGTLIDSEVLWVEAVEVFLRERGIEINGEKALEMVYGVAWPEVHATIVERFPVLATSIGEMSEELRPYFLRLRDSRDIRIPSSIELLKRLSQEYPVCIVSGSWRDEIARAIAYMRIEPYLAFYVGGEQYSPGKPDPACYLLGAKELDVPPAECLVFEDSALGIRAAKAAGMQCVALARPGRPDQDVSDADWVLDDLGKFSVAAYSRHMG